MKKLYLLLPSVFFIAGGCLSSQTARVVKALGNDQAGLSISVDTLYGKVHIVRANPNSETPGYTISPDGTINVGGQSGLASPQVFMIEQPAIVRQPASTTLAPMNVRRVANRTNAPFIPSK